MPTWDEITPYAEHRTVTGRVNATNALVVLNIAGFVLPAFFILFKVPPERFLAFDFHRSVEGLWLWQFLSWSFYHPIGFGDNSVSLLWSILGLALGCYLLHMFGRELEIEWGWRRYVTFYLASGVYGAVVHALFQVLSNATIEAYDFLGPVLAIYLVSALRNPHRGALFLFFIPMKAITSALLAIGLVAVYCIANAHSGYSPVASLGAVGAGYLIYVLEPRVDALLDSRVARGARRRFLEEFEIRRQADAILDKINRQGLQSLSPGERRLLKRASRLLNDDRGRPHE